ncbi:MAG: Nif3-like dinuclear metal center hexameric protein [Halanaerobiaceae bacterium]
MTQIKDVIKILNQLAPDNLAFEWDSVGMQVGDVNNNVKNILVTLDVNEKVIEEALDKNCQLILSHHPFIFKPLDKIINTGKGELIFKLIKNNISLFSMHTNLDIVSGGLNDYLADILKLNNVQLLKTIKEKKLNKLVVFIPENHLNEVRDALLNNGAGFLGNYSHTSFITKGSGSFKPLAGSKPFMGKENKINVVEEYRFETIIEEEKIGQIVAIMKDVHPYEEVAYDLYPLNNKSGYGLGRIGNLNREYNLADYLKIVKDKLNISQLKYVGELDKRIKRVAVCSGSGADLISLSQKMGADLYITADIKYHDAQFAETIDIALLEAGHYQSEIIVKNIFKEYLDKKMDNKSLDISILKSEINTDPWNYL